MAKIERSRAVYGRLGVGKTTFDENYVDRDGSNSTIPGTDIPRLRPVQLGPRAIGFFSDEIDSLLEALRRMRDATPRKAPKPAVDPIVRRRQATEATPPRPNPTSRSIRPPGTGAR